MLIHHTLCRIPSYRGRILKGLATCWLHYYSNKNIDPKHDAEMIGLLQEAFKLLKEASREHIKVC